MSRLVRHALLAACVLLGPAAAGAGEPERHALLRIADADDPGREDALEAWKALSDLERTKQIRAALRSEDPALAFAAAVAASPWSLDLEEMHLRGRAMQRSPLAWIGGTDALKDVADDYLGYGAPDLLAIWRACAVKDPTVERVEGVALHRVLLPERVPELVPLLETAGPIAFRALLEDIRLLAESVAGDEQHAAYVRAFRYGLRRLQAELEKRPRPKFADVPESPAKPGLPAEFVELARGCWGPEGTGFGLAGFQQAPRRDGLKATAALVRGPDFWLHRWAQRLAPGADDVQFLVELIESRALPQTKSWAARRIATLEGREAGHALARVLAPGGEERVWAAAERAVRGDRKAWGQLQGAVGLGKEGAAAVASARWLVDPAAARAAATNALLQGDEPADLTVDDRWFLASDYGFEIAEEHLDGIAARLAAGGAPLPQEMWFFAEVHPGWLTPERAAALAVRWAREAQRAPVMDGRPKKALALLEAFAPEATRALLRAWAVGADDEDARTSALGTLACLGDAVLIEPMLAAWPDWQNQESAALGRVRTPEVEAFLRAKAEAPDAKDPKAEAEAVEALAVFHGCPEPLARFLGPMARDDEELSAKTWAEVKALVLAKDPVGAVLRRTRDGPLVGGVSDEEICAFGLAQDPRVLQRLGLWRERRDFDLYWVATACLAMQGEERARTEWRGFLADARTFLLDHLQLWPLFTLNGDPDWTDEWVARLDANCCYGRHAQECVKASFPTFPFGHYPSGAGRTRLGAERWFTRHKGTFVRSPILDGWIPGPRR